MGTLIRITREFSFEMAHVLDCYNGLCRNLHGHSYKLFVTVAGVPVNDRTLSMNGMVMDFSDLKKLVNEKIIKIFDHSVVVSRDFERSNHEFLSRASTNMVVMDNQPTCENLVADFASRLQNCLPQGIKLYSLRLYETSKSYAEWYASDNL